MNACSKPVLSPSLVSKDRTSFKNTSHLLVLCSESSFRPNRARREAASSCESPASPVGSRSASSSCEVGATLSLFFGGGAAAGSFGAAAPSASQGEGRGGISIDERTRRARASESQRIVTPCRNVPAFFFLAIFPDRRSETQPLLSTSKPSSTSPTRASPLPGTISPSSCPATVPSPCRPGSALRSPEGPREARPRRGPAEQSPCRRRRSSSRP